MTRVCIDPDLGGATNVSGGVPTVILAAGYVGSTLFGGVLIMSGFDTLVAKILSFIVAIGLLCPLVLVRDKLYALDLYAQYAKRLTIPLPLSCSTILLTACYEGLLIGFWFVDHAYVPSIFPSFLIPTTISPFIAARLEDV